MDAASADVERYQHAWRDFAKRRRDAALLLWGGPPAIFGLAILLVRLTNGDAAPLTVLGLGAPWLIAFYKAQLWRLKFRCPRCGNYFRRPDTRPFALVCRFCGTRAGEGPTSPSQPAA